MFKVDLPTHKYNDYSNLTKAYLLLLLTISQLKTAHHQILEIIKMSRENNTYLFYFSITPVIILEI